MSKKNCSLAYNDEMDVSYDAHHHVIIEPSLQLIIDKRSHNEDSLPSVVCDNAVVEIKGSISVSF